MEYWHEPAPLGQHLPGDFRIAGLLRLEQRRGELAEKQQRREGQEQEPRPLGAIKRLGIVVCLDGANWEERGSPPEGGTAQELRKRCETTCAIHAWCLRLGISLEGSVAFGARICQGEVYSFRGATWADALPCAARDDTVCCDHLEPLLHSVGP